MRILIAIDGSANAGEALRLGAQLARRAGDSTTILTVVESGGDRLTKQGNLILEQAYQELGIPSAQIKLRTGHPPEEIIRETEEQVYNLVVVGEGRHRVRLTRFLLGSTALRVAEHVSCSVIITKGKARPIKRILLCDSGAEDSSSLSRFTCQLAKALVGEEQITVLHVMSQISAGPGVIGVQLRANAEELIKERAPEGAMLQRNLKTLDRPGIHPYPKVRHGLVEDEILAEDQGGDYDLVVIGAHRAGGWQRLLLDDLARKLLVRLDRPVLVVK
jgi:nucleotide-binding universal stress UspA family protein